MLYWEWNERGAKFLTKPLDNHGAEQRCYLRDPDGYLIELGASTPRAVPGLTRAAVTASNRRRRPPVLVRDPARRIVAYVSRPGCYWAQG